MLKTWTDDPHVLDLPVPELLKRTQAARLLCVHPSTIDRWSRLGLLNPIRLPSGQNRYRLAELKAIKRGSVWTKEPDVEAVTHDDV